jgi:glycosyltransferase involved in cell wall biosynthesis
VRIISEGANGKGSALRAGFEASTGDAIVMLDADGSMSATEIPRFLHFLDHGYDFVKGSRFVAGGGSFDITRLRRVGNRGLMALVNVLYDTTLTDLCYGFVAFRRRYLPYLRLRSDGFEIETEMVLHALRAGLRIAEVPSIELPRRSGQSRLRTFHDGARVLRTVMNERFGLVDVSGSAEAEVRSVG